MKTSQISVIYMVNCILNLLINFDHGIIPACTKEMKADLAIDDFELGMLGSAVYAGLVIGSAAGSHLFSRLVTKKIIIVSVLACCLSLYVFLMSKNFYVLLLSRFMVGFCQIFLVIWFPVWIDFFGGQYKTLWLTFMQLGVALGAVAGYLVTSLFVSYTGSWVEPYQLQILLLIPCAIFYWTTAEYNLDTTGQMHLLDRPILNQEEISVKSLLNNRMFIYSMMSLTTLFFVVNGIQFWISDYFRNVLNVPQQTVFKVYMLVSLSAPILGVAMGGIVLHYSGGYDGQHALKIQACEAALASLSGAPIPLIDDFKICVICLWGMLFFGGSLVPGMTGIMISSIPPELRSVGNSVSHIFQELLGYLPSPMLYGLVTTLTGGPTSRWGMVLLVTWSFQGVVYIGLAYQHSKKNKPPINITEVEMNPFQNTDIPQPEKTRAQTFTKPGFFQELRQQTSMSMGDSQILAFGRSRAQSIDTPYTHHMRTMSRQRSVLDVMLNVANLMGRQSIDINKRDWD